jgi:hypothetical protein
VNYKFTLPERNITNTRFVQQEVCNRQTNRLHQFYMTTVLLHIIYLPSFEYAEQNVSRDLG